MVPGERRAPCHRSPALLLTFLALVVALSPLSASDPGGPLPGRPVSSIRQDREEVAWVATLRVWRTAVEDHQPGTRDAAAVGVNAWSRRDLTTVLTDLVSLRDLLLKAKAKLGQASGTISYSRHFFTIPDIEDLLGLTHDEVAQADFNRLLKRAAILHTDIATLLAGESTPFQTPGNEMLRSQDGRASGFTGTVHWEVARKLLDAVTPDPAGNEFVRAWYRATTAFLQYELNLAYADPHLERAREIFPKDATLLFDSGCLDEMYAGPLVQGVARSAGAVAGSKVRTPTSHWRQAERFFRDALAADAGMVQARLRLGRVIGLLGRHEEAIGELQRAVEASDDPLLRYYGEMFLGGERRALGQDAAARTHFERAARLYPSAQAPYVALSDIGRRAGDRTAALDTIRRMFSVTADLERLVDPWWEYHRVAFSDADQLMAQCRRALETRKAP
jgi:tetratricopeptide (TPR) repeat protein